MNSNLTNKIMIDFYESSINQFILHKHDLQINLTKQNYYMKGYS